MGPDVTVDLEVVRATVALLALAFAGAPGPDSPVDLEVAAQSLLTDIISKPRLARHVIVELTRIGAGAVDELAQADGYTGAEHLAWVALWVETDRCGQ
jgi:hypothetical protein